jgi:hypothetical protein
MFGHRLQNHKGIGLNMPFGMLLPVIPEHFFLSFLHNLFHKAIKVGFGDDELVGGQSRLIMFNFSKSIFYY